MWWFKRKVKVQYPELDGEVKDLSIKYDELRKQVNRLERYYYRHKRELQDGSPDDLWNNPVLNRSDSGNGNQELGLEDLTWLNK